MTKTVLAFWDRRVLVEPIRLLLHFKNVPFEDKKYAIPQDGTWEKEKHTLGLDFPCLPYYIDKEVKLTQRIAILRYLARKHDLDGKTSEDRLRVSLAEQQISDDYMAFIVAVVIPDAKKLDEYMKTVPDSFKLLSNFIGNRKFIAGDYVTYADFLTFELLDFHILFSKNAFDDFPVLKEYHERFRNLTELQPYFNSPSYKRWPLFKPTAAWGGSDDMPQ